MNDDDPPFRLPVTIAEMQAMSTPDGAWSLIDWPRFKALLLARDFPAEQILKMERDMALESDDGAPTLH